jgi:hypothetical protein
MNATRTEPRQHCYQRPVDGAYVTAAATTSEHLRAVFAAERERLAAAARPRRGRRPRAAVAAPQPLQAEQQAQLQLVA